MKPYFCSKNKAFNRALGIAKPIAFSAILTTALAEELPKAGDTFLHPKTEKTMVLVPSGNYLPFRLQGGGDFIAELQPTGEKKTAGALYLFGTIFHRWATGLFMDKTEVSNEDFLRYVQDANSEMPKKWNNKVPSGEDLKCPAIVSFEQAESYCKWAGLRLPTLHEFCAATSNDDGKFPWLPIANFFRQDPKFNPAGTNKDDISPLGIHDLIGNAPEWGATMIPFKGKTLYLRFFMAALGKSSDDPMVSDGVSFFELNGENVMNGDSAFRCVDDSVAIKALLAGQLVGWSKDKTFPKPSGSPMRLIFSKPSVSGRSVRLINKTNDPILVKLSNGEEFKMNAEEEVSREFLPGSYLILYAPVSAPEKWRFLRVGADCSPAFPAQWIIGKDESQPVP
jgi:formylglycine-generating enzyme required for sulfatase activity